jgi:hypothetical protein
MPFLEVMSLCVHDTLSEPELLYGSFFSFDVGDCY